VAKRVITKASRRRLTVFGSFSLGAILWLVISLIYNIYIINDLYNQKKELEKNYNLLVEEAEQLKLDINKLNDPEYLADYARENYLYSKEGEYIIQMGEEIIETTETIDAITLSINKNYVLLGLCLFIILIFMYIILKGKNNVQKKEL